MSAFRYEVERVFSFDACHKIGNLAPGHPEGSLHGHTFTVSVKAFADDLDATGWVVDPKVFDIIRGKLDHSNLNDVLGGDKSTPESICTWVFDTLSQVLYKLGAVDEVHISSVSVSDGQTSAVLSVRT